MDVLDLRREAAETEFDNYCFAEPGDKDGWIVKDSGGWTYLADRLVKPVYLENDFEADASGHYPSVEAEFTVIFDGDTAVVTRAFCELDGEVVGRRGGTGDTRPASTEADRPTASTSLSTGLIDPADVIGYEALRIFAHKFSSIRPDAGPGSTVIGVLLTPEHGFLNRVKDLWVLTYNSRHLTAKEQDEFAERFGKGRELWYFHPANVDVTSLLLMSRKASHDPAEPEGDGSHGQGSPASEAPFDDDEPAPGTPHTKVEYDLSFFGGDYSAVGRFALVPHSLIDAHGGEVPAAFRAHTGIDPVHIIHYCVDEAYDEKGEFIEGPV